MKILYLIYGEQSGVSEYLAKAFAKKDVQLDILEVGNALNYRCRRLKLPSLAPKDLINDFLSMAQFRKEWRRYYKFTSFAFKNMTRYAEKYIKKNINRYDVVLQAGAMFAPSFNELSMPYTLYLDHTHNISENYPEIKGVREPARADSAWKKMEKGVYERASLIFTMSVNVKKSLLCDYNIEAKKIIVVGAGPNIKTIPGEFKKENNHNRILFVGEDFSRKGGDALINAYRSVRKDIPDSELVIVGCEPKVSEEGVIIKGRLPKDRVIDEYKSATIFALPSLREPFGISFLEAMVYSLPCIGTDIEAIPEIIDDGKTGFIIPANNDTELSHRISMLLKDKELARQMGENGYKKVIERFTWDKVADKIISSLETIGKN